MSEPIYLKLHDSVFKFKEGAAPATMTNAVATKVEFDEEDGMKMYLQDCKYPINGFTGKDEIFALSDCDVVKKYLKGWLTVAGVRPVRYFLPLLVLFPSFKKLASEWIITFNDFAFHQLKEYVWEEKFYSRAVKQIRKGILNCKEEGMEIRTTRSIDKMADIFSVVLEQDRPYRYDLQDICSLVSMDALRKSTAKELKRILSIFGKRNHERNWATMATAVYLLVKLRPEIKKFVLKFFEGMDLSRMKMDINDKYHSYPAIDYDFDDLNSEQRAALWEKMHNE